MNYTDNQLKAALAKMLPDKLILVPYGREDNLILSWICTDITGTKKHYVEVLDTELLHLCGLVQEEYEQYILLFYHPKWQQRVITLAKVKGIEI